MIRFSSRKFQAAIAPDKPQTELDSTWEFFEHELSLPECGFLLIDVWANFTNQGWLERARQNLTQYLEPTVERLRCAGAKIFHAGHGVQPYHPPTAPREGEWDLHALGAELPETFIPLLHSQGIRHLFYLGYSSNWCILNRGVGALNMRYREFELYLIRDCSIAFETPESIGGEWAHQMAVNFFEHQCGRTLLSTDLQLPSPSHPRESVKSV